MSKEAYYAFKAMKYKMIVAELERLEWERKKKEETKNVETNPQIHMA